MMTGEDDRDDRIDSAIGRLLKSLLINGRPNLSTKERPPLKSMSGDKTGQEEISTLRIFHFQKNLRAMLDLNEPARTKPPLIVNSRGYTSEALKGRAPA